jgi:hypothetical protein
MFLGAITVTGNATAQELSIRGGFTGNWYNPDHDHQGLQIEVIDPRQAVVAWYTYDDAGEPVWLFGVGGIRGDTIEVPLDSFGGGRFPTASDRGTVNIEPWGTAEIQFADCNSAELRWETESADFDDGTLPLTRLTNMEGRRCGQAEDFQRAIRFSFEQGADSWSAVFADYSEEQLDTIGTAAGWTGLPFPLRDRNGFRLSGKNVSDDLAMFLKHPIAGLAPDTEYRVELAMTFATNVPQGCVGTGAPPGESVYMKLGAAGIEPMAEETSGDFRLNIDKGNQSQGGEDAIVVGDMTSTQGEELCGRSSDWRWELKAVSTEGRDFTATTSSEGVLWVYGGSDSGFESRTTFYVTDFTARLAPIAE